MDLTSKDLTGAAIKVLRHIRGFSAVMLSHDTGVALTTISKMENGHMPVTKPAKEKIAAALGLGPDDIEELADDLTAYQNRMISAVTGAPMMMVQAPEVRI